MVENPHPKYRPDIDGLRAIAVWSVVAFHAFPGWVRGGFVGVDVFFVISGFLISTIIFGGVARGTFSYADFYAKRVRRIFPALLAMLAAVTLYAWQATFSFEFARIARHVAAGAGFVSNLLLWSEVGYFDPAAELKPLLHLWSLGVEEQYYIVWPLVVGALFSRLHRLLPIVWGVLLASFALNIALVGSHPDAAFFLPVTRFWELMLGSLLAYGALSAAAGRGLLVRLRLAGGQASAGRRDALSALGVALVALAVFVTRKDHAFPGWWALLPTLGALAIIAAGPQAWLNRRLLASRPFVFFGLISYPLYLWHWPILSLLRIESGGDLSRPVKLAAVAAAVALAWLTYRYVERPIRFGAGVPRATAVLASVMTLVGVGALMAAQSLGSDTPQERYVRYFENSDPNYRYAVAHDLFAAARQECNFYDVSTKRARQSIEPGCYSAGSGPKVMIWGDSFAQQFNRALAQALPAGTALLQVATSGCRPSITHVEHDPFGACNRSNEFALETVERQRPDVIVVAQKGGHEATDWQAFAAEVARRGGSKLLLVGPSPQWSPDLYRVVARRYLPTPPARLADHLAQDALRSETVLKQRLAGAAAPRYVSLIDALCNDEGCLAFLGPDPYEDITAFDYGHFTPRALDWLAARVLAPAVRELLAKAH